jgi:hypothetical protein
VSCTHGLGSVVLFSSIPTVYNWSCPLRLHQAATKTKKLIPDDVHAAQLVQNSF